MVLGAQGSRSTAETNDEQTFIEKMYNLMQAGGALPSEVTIEQAYPFPKGIITVDSAKRQNLDNIDELHHNMDAQQEIGPAGMVMNPTNEKEERLTKSPVVFDFEQLEQQEQPTMMTSQDGETLHRTSQGDNIPVDNGLTHDQQTETQQVLTKQRDGRDSADVPVPKTPARQEQHLQTPPGIDVQDSKALARRLELSSLALEKIQLSAKSFGVIRPDNDISLPENELVILDKARKSFGLIQNSSLPLIDEHMLRVSLNSSSLSILCEPGF